MSGLNQKDLDILRAYADDGNRERYWNYLAQKQGNDGYGLLALGVVRNDNLPGQVANAYAQLEAADQHDRNPKLQNRTLTERQWEAFGQMLGFFAIDHAEAGMDDRELSWYADLPPSDAALAYGQDFDLCRVDTFWPSPGLRRIS